MKTFLRTRWRELAAALILLTGTLQMVGHLTGSLPLRGVGALCGWAPFPKVFCDMDGYEGFTASFTFHGRRSSGETWAMDLTPEIYGQLRGPYNRRNVYGALLAGAPRLPQPLGHLLTQRALSPDGSLWQELSLPDDLTQLSLRVTPRDGAAEGPWDFPITLDPSPQP